ncbi:BZ3500_MvSof-1268-A1-R1_Chr2-1g04138 [Microbotryum saponariae]|uniref:BZ3500_MvSof-1268-A1-R1_Chr2-1g04138 protein n=1 Tax=Microbotryum saponariae TaxID=289078 RepID=A0A2X0MHS2_9BASI|nr:BZ3500_MvSof-1268-A1-R1_Chr2-1g04138 [Microbotryum saponariae]SCZ91125.1 BZ3501_MvSof-1269-A2-R1_Chr2-1g03794 [Microbotryum saponariae]
MEPQASLARRPSATTVNISPAHQDDPIDYSHSSARSSSSPHPISLPDSGRIGTGAFSQGQHLRKESFPSPFLDIPGASRRSVPALFGNSNLSNGAGARGSTSSGPRTPHVNANTFPSYGGARRAFYTTKSQPGWKRTLRLVRDVVLRPIYLVGRRGPLIPLLLVLISFGLFLTYSTSPSSQKVKLRMQGAVGPYIPQRAASVMSWHDRASEEAESGAGLDDEESDYTPPGSKKPTEATKGRQGKLPKAKSTLSTAIELPAARRDGRLLLKEGEVHPIPAMMARAKRQWKELKGQQSKTFKEAVAEYEKRYRRKPPKGFDQWYAFAKAHKVVLIDEFDLIDKDLLMYRAFDPPHFRNRVKYTSTYLDMLWNMTVTNGVISRAGQLENHDRARGVEFLASRFAHLLPDMTIMYNGHDGARIAVAAEERARLENLVKKGECEPLKPVSAGCTADTSVLTTIGRVTAFVLTDEPDEGAPYPPKEIGPWPHHSMPAFCPNGTAVRGKVFEYGWASMDSTGYEMPAPVPGSIGSLVDGFKQYMDVCDSPQYRHFHATTSWVYTHHPTPVVPLFTPGVQTTFGDVHSLIVEQLELEAKHDPKWEERPFSSLQWRGQTSGPLWEKTSPWRTTQRARLHLLSHQESGTRNITLTDEDDKIRLVEVPNFKLNPLFLDTGMVGPAVQCVKEDGTCDEMQEVFQGYDKRISFDRAALYKYVLDVDGNSWSGRFRRLMLSNAAVVKATIFPEFWTDWAIPWLHFIPMQVDYSDMWDILAFFRGGINGEGAHDALGKQIAMAGKEWVRSCYRWADLEAYQFRLMLEYGRLYNDETEPGSKDFNGDTSIEPVWKGEVKLE